MKSANYPHLFQNCPLIVICFFLFFGCKKEQPKPTPCDPIIVTETVYVGEGYKNKFDSIAPLLTKIQAENDSLTAINNIIAGKLLSSNLMIENARYYLKITINNPSQDKFLKGWMRRALEVE